MYVYGSCGRMYICMFILYIYICIVYIHTYMYIYIYNTLKRLAPEL